jgi:hypothetical protein
VKAVLVQSMYYTLKQARLAKCRALQITCEFEESKRCFIFYHTNVNKNKLWEFLGCQSGALVVSVFMWCGAASVDD